ncbi:hypothetical protein GDO86_007358 [Hymenochirus boettgeri]|uniref:Uncharacterized protein n=1 Tax=Hymenochirus boettgeri TaxID=247094 RepID=A0A8T2IW87_9PIPI|nr:hypothetical protein GDO86_007358 [Hymenochirus boettgeri]
MFDSLWDTLPKASSHIACKYILSYCMACYCCTLHGFISLKKLQNFAGFILFFGSLLIFSSYRLPICALRVIGMEKNIEAPGESNYLIQSFWY